MPELQILSRPPLDRLVNEYLTDARARGLSPKTVSGAYGYPLRSVFLPYCARLGVTEPGQLDKAFMNRFTTELLDTGGKRGTLSPYSVHAYVRNVNQFLRWAEKEGEQATAKGQLPKLPRRHIDVLSRKEIDTLEDCATSERDKLVVRVLADTGMRAGELCGLRLSDLVEDSRRAFLQVRGKGGDHRLIPVQPKLARRLRRFAEKGRPSDAPDRLFLAVRRRPDGTLQALHESGVLQIVRTLGEKARLKKPVYSHLFRHSFITNALRQGSSPLLVAKMVGHSSLTMIQRNYEHLVAEDTYDALGAMLGDQ